MRALKKEVLMLAVVCLCSACGASKPTRVLRVCADPNNLPFSNDRGEGFENRIVEVIAAQLGARVEYTWWAQRRGFIRNTLKAGICDLVPGIPAGTEAVSTTRPYYRSSYVFATRTRSGLHPTSFDSPELRRVRVGVQLIGDDYANTPPVHALAQRGIVQNIVGFRVAGNYAEPDPPARLMEALSRGDIDIAIAWGPLAGYHSRRSAEPLDLSPVPADASSKLPFAFDIAMAVRPREDGFKAEIQAALDKQRQRIASILEEFGVPLVEMRAEP